PVESAPPRTAYPIGERSRCLRAAEDSPRERAGRLAVGHRDDPVHQDPLDSFRITVGIVLEWILVRPEVRRAISNPRQVEDDEVRPAARAADPPDPPR